MWNFRHSLITTLLEQKVTVHIAVPEDEYSHKLKELGPIQLHTLNNLHRHGVNPLQETQLLLELIQLYRTVKPDIVHHFTIKCVLWGTFAAKIANIPGVVNAVTGLGHVFISNGLIRYLRPFIQLLYRIILTSRRQRVIFQNPDDLDFFQTAGMIDQERTFLIPSSGVDPKRFTPPEQPRQYKKPYRILMVGRLLKEKGIYEFVEAAQIIKEQYPEDFQFLVAGLPDDTQPSSITQEQLLEWQESSPVEFLGHVDNMIELYQSVDLLTLPSYREGTPKTVIEAAVCELPAVVSDAPGCRLAVIPHKTGIQVPVKDASALAQGIIDALADPQKTREWGKKAREYAIEHFSTDIVNQKTFAIYESLIKATQA